jgi:hypothetical protein
MAVCDACVSPMCEPFENMTYNGFMQPNVAHSIARQRGNQLEILRKTSGVSTGRRFESGRLAAANRGTFQP